MTASCGTSPLDPDPWRLGPWTPHLERTPELLGDLIRYGHAVRGIRQELTDDALAAVDKRAAALADGVRELSVDVDPAGSACLHSSSEGTGGR
jgi:hypothetical protein